MLNENHRCRAYKLAFYLCLFVILYITLLSRTPFSRAILTRMPFEGYKKALSGNQVEFLFIIENILLFIPLGFCRMGILCIGNHPDKRKNSALRAFLFGTFLTLFIELSQYVFQCGLFEVDDIVDNMLGTILGIILYQIAIAFCRKFQYYLLIPENPDAIIK